MEIRPITFKATYEYRKNGCYFVKEGGVSPCD